MGFFLNPGTYWPHSLFEPLVVGISFAMRNRQAGPWLVRQERDKVVEVGRALSQESKKCHVRVRDYLRKLWRNPWDFPEMPGGMVC